MLIGTRLSPILEWGHFFFTPREILVFSEWLSREIFLLNISVYLSLFFWTLTCNDSITLETSIPKETTSENQINKISLHLLTVSHYFDPIDNDSDATDADADNTTNVVSDDTIDASWFPSRCCCSWSLDPRSRGQNTLKTSWCGVCRKIL